LGRVGRVLPLVFVDSLSQTFETDLALCALLRLHLPDESFVDAAHAVEVADVVHVLPVELTVADQVVHGEQKFECTVEYAGRRHRALGDESDDRGEVVQALFLLDQVGVGRADHEGLYVCAD